MVHISETTKVTTMVQDTFFLPYDYYYWIKYHCISQYRLYILRTGLNKSPKYIDVFSVYFLFLRVHTFGVDVLLHFPCQYF